MRQGYSTTLVQYLINTRDLHDHRKAIVIGGRVAQRVHDGSHLLYPVQTGDRRTHHFSGGRKILKKNAKTRGKPKNIDPGPYLAVSQWEVAGASQWRKGTLCSLMWMSYRP